jgi:hypothetical protein
MVAGIIVGKNVLRDLVPLPIVSQLRRTVAKEPENQRNQQDKLADIKQRGSMNFAPDNSVGRVSLANHGRVVNLSWVKFSAACCDKSELNPKNMILRGLPRKDFVKLPRFTLIFYFCDFCAFLRPYQFLCNAIMKMG